MPSPYRKPRAQRRGGYDQSRELEPPARKAPSVPVSTWPAEVKRWWRGIWTTGVAGEWDRVADLPSVRRLGDLYALQASGEPLTAAVLAQIVKLEQELLLTPAARKRAYVRLPDPADELTTTRPAVDYRAMLADDEDQRRAARRARLTETGVDRPDPFDGLRLTADGTVVDLNENGD